MIDKKEDREKERKGGVREKGRKSGKREVEAKEGRDIEKNWKRVKRKQNKNTCR